MSGNQLILEGAFSNNGKFYLYLFFLFILCFSITMIVGISGPMKLIGIIILILVLITAFSILTMKKGLIKNDKGLNFGYFSWGNAIYKTPINYNNFSAVSILKFKRRERGAYLSVANPEFSSSFNSYEIYTLNEKHTTRRKILALKKVENANMAIDFILKHSDLKYEIYSPDFSK